MSAVNKPLTALILMITFILAGCSSVDSSRYQQFSQADCNLEGITTGEPQRLRFEVVRPAAILDSSLTDSTDLEGVAMLENGQQSMVFDGAVTRLDNDSEKVSKIWILASLGKTRDGSMCIETRTATRFINTDTGFNHQTVMAEKTHKIDRVGACGEFFVRTSISGANNAYLRISTAPKSTAEYLNNPGVANSGLCAEVVESLPSDSREQIRNQLKAALGV
jgi:PBP1b-binding outer membrane lipoprotein LpoB